MLGKALDHSMEFPGDIFLQLSKMVTTLKYPLPEKRQSRLVVMSHLFSLACQQSYSVSRVIVGLALLLSKLPNKPIINVSSISETEIWNGYHDPLLTGILGDPEKNFILRWVNKITPEGRRISSGSRPDAIISVFTQANYDKTIGHGEAKVTEPTCNSDALCRDLLRLATFGKNTVDSGTTSMAIGFQMHSFNIQFYLVELYHEALYTMTELVNIQVPDSLSSFSHLLSTDTLDKVHSDLNRQNMGWNKN
ncbi:hypothetical protein BDC45DRAFT_279786 [Circinella umbellata]|nr:hypothetical protein BDC45DRAFT_279786 [Circinella umbellata]